MRGHTLPMLAIATAIATIVAVVPRPAAAADVSSEDVRAFDRFLDDHPWVERDLQRDPALVNDPRYIDDHRSLADFLGDHPDVRRELRRDPYAMLRRQHRIERAERRGREISRQDLDRFDRFLRDHPAVAHDLRSDPSLVNSRRYLADHPSFQDFLRDHPDIREELQDNPYAFMRRFDRYRTDESRHEQRRGKH